MNELIQRQFERIGARVVVRAPDGRRRAFGAAPVGLSGLALDVRRDRSGEYFDLAVDRLEIALQVIDLRPRDRHLLLMSRSLNDGAKDKFLCGHDERHWFVAAVPRGPASSVAGAMEALKPVAVQTEQSRRRVRRKHRNSRRNAAFVRQGEWFFVPVGDAIIPETTMLQDEPLRRGGGKAHWAEYVVRLGGEAVYVNRRCPNGLRPTEYGALLGRNPKARQWRWQVLRRDARVYAKGCIRHPDHQTIVLPGWHRVVLNRESEAPGMRQVAFLD